MDAARIELMQRMPIFGGISAETIAFLHGLAPQVSLATGSYFFREHEPGDCMFVLQAGNVEVVKSWAGHEHRLQVLGAGDCFGEMAVMDPGPRSAGVRALEDCSAIRISAADLYKVYARDLKQFTLMQMNMGREVCRRLRHADGMLFRAAMEATAPDGGHLMLAV